MKEYIAEYIVPVVPAGEKGKNLKFDFVNAKRLIRCKDCKAWATHNEKFGTCRKLISLYETCADDFCSIAERKETS